MLQTILTVENLKNDAIILLDSNDLKLIIRCLNKNYDNEECDDSYLLANHLVKVLHPPKIIKGE